MIKSFLGTGDKYGVSISFSEEKEPLGTCGPLTLLKHELNEEPFLLINGDILTKFDFSMYQTDEEGNITAEKIPRTINYDESLFLHLSYISQHRETAFLYPTRDVFDKKFNGSVSLYDTFISVNMIRDAFETHSAIGDAITYILKKINAESMGIVKLTYSPGDNINSISISDVNHDIQTKTKETLPEPYLFSLNSPNTIVNSGELRSNLQNNDLTHFNKSYYVP